jgi:hypothetical protein
LLLAGGVPDDPFPELTLPGGGVDPPFELLAGGAAVEPPPPLPPPHAVRVAMRSRKHPVSASLLFMIFSFARIGKAKLAFTVQRREIT